jgi:hypothetical protein
MAIQELARALYDMHLRFERLLIHSLVLVPLAFFAILLLVLLPYMAWHSPSTAHSSLT